NTYYLFGWNPFLCVYNWSDGSGSWWDKTVKKIGIPPVVYDSTMVESTNKGMINHLEYQGYYNSKVTNRIEKKGKLVRVYYDVELGKQFPIKDLSLTVRDTAIARLIEQNSKDVNLKQGDPLSQEMLETESEKTAKMLRNNGYYGFTKNYFFFSADTISAPDSALLYVRLANHTRNESSSMDRPHRVYTIGNVSITPTGNLKVRESFLKNINRVQPGTQYNENVINNTYQRFTSHSLFSSVNMNLDPVDSTTVDCNILLSPSKLQGFKTKLEASVNSTGLIGISPSLSYYHKNIFHGGETLNLGFMGNFQFMTNKPVSSKEFAVSASISFPKFVLLPDKVFDSSLPRTDVTANFNYQSRPEYKRTIISASYGYTWNLRQRHYFQISPIKANIVRIRDLDSTFIASLKNPYMMNSYVDHFDLGGSVVYYYTTASETNPKVSYFYARCQVDFAGNLMNLLNDFLKKDKSGQAMIWDIPYSQYVRTELSVVPTIRFGHNDQFAFAFRGLIGVGVPYKNSISMPFEKLFYAGGSNSLRGWQARSVGPGKAQIEDAFRINNQTGDIHLEANAEFRFPIVWKLNGALFADAGNIWSLPTKTHTEGESEIYEGTFIFKDVFKSSAFAYGLGIRLDFGLLLVRLDLGLKGYDPSKQAWYKASEWFTKNGYALHFAIGYPF
ncbi:MAG: BamA/TamA family outer membrane protein, partial [Bacteroidales bacterium]|nr:BamA/TamA family outer membrane protein [Bacteroidales bacterium]